MADERDPIEQLLDAALFGPVGLFLELRERFPELADKGRQHLQTQVTVARMVGQFAVQMGSKKVAEYVARQRATTDAPSASPASPSPSNPSASDPSAAPGASAAGDGDTRDAGAGEDAGAGATGGSADRHEPEEVVPGWVAADLVATAVDELPIAGYDTLAASQVVARLDGLDAAGLEAVRVYEATHRNRKTILGKVAQLQRAA